MPSKRGRGARPDQTRQKLLDAAVTTLKQVGYAGVTARAVAGEAGCNQASIYYHFGGMSSLLAAALAEASQRRLDAYRTALAGLDRPDEILATWRELYAEDLRTGQIRALAELVGATAVEPELRDGVAAVTSAWRQLAEETVARAVEGTALAAVVPVGEAADVLLAVTLGAELLEHIDGDHARATRLFDAGNSLVALLPALAESLPTPPDPQRR